MSLRRIKPRDLLTHLTAIALAALTAAVIFAPFASGAAKSKAYIACGGDRNSVEDQFQIAHASDIWTVFPAMPKAPELENDQDPAEVVTFSGDVDLSGMVAAPGTVPKVADVVCVVQSDGTVNLYDGVSRAGFRHP